MKNIPKNTYILIQPQSKLKNVDQTKKTEAIKNSFSARISWVYLGYIGKIQLNYGKLFAKNIKEVQKEVSKSKKKEGEREKTKELRQKQLLSWPLHKLAVRPKWHSVYGQVVHTHTLYIHVHTYTPTHSPPPST